MIQYLENQITRNLRLNEYERLDLLDHITPNQNRTSQNLTNGPKKIRPPQLVSNNITPIDPLEISEQSNENEKSTDTKPDLPSGNPEQSANSAANKKKPRLNIIKDLYSRSLLTIRHHANN